MFACFYYPSSIQEGKVIKLTFFTYDNGITREYQAIRLS